MTDLSYNAAFLYKDNRYVIYFPDLIDGVTVAKTIDEIPKRAKSLMLSLLAVMKCLGQEPPEPIYAPGQCENNCYVSANLSELEESVQLLKNQKR